MKVFDIAFKDMLRYFRSTFAVGMMLVVPLLITGLIYAAFGGVLSSSETSGLHPAGDQSPGRQPDQGDARPIFNAGQVLVDALT